MKVKQKYKASIKKDFLTETILLYTFWPHCQLIAKTNIMVIKKKQSKKCHESITVLKYF